jgi:hypothetical protein
LRKVIRLPELAKEPPSGAIRNITSASSVSPRNGAEEYEADCEIMATNAQAEQLKLEGNELIQKGKHQEALKKYKKAAKLDPTCAIYWSNMAACYEKLGDLLEFKKSAQKCIESDPTFVKGYYRLAAAQRRLWEYEDEMLTIQRGLEADPNQETLLKMKDENKEKLQFRQKFQKATLTVPEQDFEYFGGLQPGSSFRIPRDTAYFQLPRPALPPYFQKHRNKSYLDERVRFAFDCFCNGDLVVQWIATEELFQLEGYVTDDPAAVVTIRAKFEPDGRGSIRTFSCHITETNQLYHNRLTTDQKQRLKLVLVQRFLRSKGSVLHSMAVLHICNLLIQECRERGSYKDVVDMRMICTDILCNQRSLFDATFVAKLGEDLEASKRFHDAAEVYLDLANGKFGQDPILPEELTRGYAALAFKRDMDYVRAEREYVGSLRAAGSNWHWRTHAGAEVNLENMMIFYEIVHRAVRSGLRTDEAHKRMQQSCILLVGLLSVAGYDGKGCTLFQEQATVANFKRILKPQYKSPRAAFRAVVSATATPSIEDYHRVLFSCHRENVFCLFTGDPGPNAEAELLRDQKQKAKSAARKQQQNTPTISMEVCSKCGKHDTKLLLCPCQTVRYCSKDCQLTHFSYHKKHCPHVKAKRQNA